ncbi:MAG TPA: peptidase S8 [Leucothrix mucor]|uniref:Peptidase S8 n=1 Tax=Leucothrix mucor TaxID=45248 RepID=A0A7V2WVD2_LEUMU|nr:peptidase S8 [Leucothrix mucor]
MNILMINTFDTKALKMGCFYLLIVCVLLFPPLKAKTLTGSPYEQIEKNNSKLHSDLQLKQYNLKRQLRALNTTDINEAQKNQWIIIDAIANGNPDVLFQDLKQLGLTSASVFGRIVSGQLPKSALNKLETLDSLHEIKRSRMVYSQGSAMTQGDKAQHSDKARDNFSVTGKGVTVAVLSDSFNCLGGADKDKQTGDLPQNVLLLEEALECEGTTDEGRALMQIVHDIAPDAKLIFQSSSNGLAKTANAILDLAFKHKVNVIIDDMKSLSANFYQEDAISQAIKKVTKAGVVYVTAAGNSGRNAYQSSYNDYINTAFELNAHDFDPTSKVDIYQRLHVPEGAGFRMVLQWDSPAYSISGGEGAQTDLDIFIFNEDHSKVLASSTFGNMGRDPVEVISFYNPQNSGQTKFDLMITKATGKSPQSMKYIILNSFDGIIQEYQTNSGGLFGHANTEAAISIGASNYQQTPAFGVTPPLLQYYSSAGGQAIKFDIKGNAINPPLIPQKPDVVAPDNVNTTFFGNVDTDKDGKPNISGSSAAAPHGAGVAALLLETNPKLQPIDIKKILQQTATDILQRNNENKTITGEGYDRDSGFGLINAETAVNLAGSYPASKPEKPNDKGEIIVNNTNKTGGGVIELFIFFIFILILVGRNFYL